jgi:perosamine synthetase
MEIQSPDIAELEEKYVLDVLRNKMSGPNKWYYNEQFEKEFAEYHNRKYGLLTPNCTSALWLVLDALGIKNSDEVIVPELTWIATAVGASKLGATIKFADINPKTLCIDTKSIERLITPKTKAIIAVGVYGNMPEMDLLENLCHNYNMTLVEDAAESIGSTYYGKKSGSFGIASCFSFHRTKTLTMGEGGMLLLDDNKLYKRCKFLRDLGRDEQFMYWNREITPKFMVPALTAALGYAQFQRLEELLNKKRQIYEWYIKELHGMSNISLNPIQKNHTNGYWSTILILDKQNTINSSILIQEAIKKEVPIRPFFYPLSSLPAFNQSWFYKKRNPIAYKITKRGVCLPSSLTLKYEDIHVICDVIKDIL